MTSHPWLRRCWVEFLQIVTNARTADALSLAACDHCATVLSSYGGSVTGSFETLEDIRRNRSNVAARCGSCDHSGVVDGGGLRSEERRGGEECVSKGRYRWGQEY